MLYQTLSAPITAQVELTTGCNNDCLYCYNHWRHDNHVPGANMHIELLNRTVHEIITNKVFQVTFTGGEVFLMRKALFSGLEQLIGAGVSCAVNSNLTLVRADDAMRMYELGLRGVMTSVCSHDPQTHDHISQNVGAFSATMSGMRIMQEAGLFVAVSMVVTRHNVSHVYETGKAMHKAGVTQFFATKASPPVNAIGFGQHLVTQQELLNVLEELHRLKEEFGMEVGILECYPLCAYTDMERYSFASDRRCSAGITTCTVGADGGVRPCSHSELVYGNVETNGLRDSWNMMVNQRDGSLLPTVCKTCTLLAHCSGGCRVDALCCNGRYDSPDPYAQPERVHEVRVALQVPVSAKPHDRFRVNPTLRIRKESFGVLAASERMLATPSLLTNDTYTLLYSLGNTTFTPGILEHQFGVGLSDACALCAMLARDGVIEAI